MALSLKLATPLTLASMGESKPTRLKNTVLQMAALQWTNSTSTSREALQDSSVRMLTASILVMVRPTKITAVCALVLQLRVRSEINLLIKSSRRFVKVAACHRRKSRYTRWSTRNGKPNTGMSSEKEA